MKLSFLIIFIFFDILLAQNSPPNSKDFSWSIVRIGGDTLSHCKLLSVKGGILQFQRYNVPLSIPTDSVKALFRKHNVFRIGMSVGGVVGGIVGGIIGSNQPQRDLQHFLDPVFDGVIIGLIAGGIFGGIAGSQIVVNERHDLSEMSRVRKIKLIYSIIHPD